MAALHQLITDDQKLQVYFEISGAFYAFNPAHWHEHIEIIYMEEGLLSATINHTTYEMKPGDLLIVNSGEIHSTQTLTEVSYLLLQIPFHYLSSSLDQATLIHFREHISHSIEDAAANALRNEFLRMKELYSQHEYGYQLPFRSSVYNFLGILFKNYSTLLTSETKEKETRDFNRMKTVFDYVKTNYTRSISLEEVAHLVSLSPEYFCRTFKRLTNQTFLEYVNTVRMVHFYNDLIQSKESITFLMDKNGITNYKVFIRMFKETYRMTPKKLRTFHESEKIQQKTSVPK